MDDLISREALVETLKAREKMYAECTYDAYNYHIAAEIVVNVESVPAVPLDKLCEWLTENDMPLANACPLIEKHHVCIQCDFFQRPVKECWKEILSKLMEEQN